MGRVKRKVPSNMRKMHKFKFIQRMREVLFRHLLSIGTLLVSNDAVSADKGTDQTDRMRKLICEDTFSHGAAEIVSFCPLFSETHVLSFKVGHIFSRIVLNLIILLWVYCPLLTCSDFMVPIYLVLFVCLFIYLFFLVGCREGKGSGREEVEYGAGGGRGSGAGKGGAIILHIILYLKTDMFRKICSHGFPHLRLSGTFFFFFFFFFFAWNKLTILDKWPRSGKRAVWHMLIHIANAYNICSLATT